jgi:hypothetical protein
MIIVALCVIIAVGCLLIGLGVGVRIRPEIEPSTDFNCPYCHIVVTGAQQLDLINHLSCVTKSELDMANQRKALEEASQVTDEYFVSLQRISTDYSGKNRHPSGSYFVYTAYDTYSAWEYVLFRNGEEIARGWGKSRDTANDNAEAQKRLDQHKRRTEHKRGRKALTSRGR